MDNNEKQQVRSRDIINVIIDNQNGQYWRLIKNELMEWLKTERKYLENEDVTSEREKIRVRIQMIERFININDDLLSRHSTIVDRIQRFLDGKNMIETFIRPIQSFVGMRK